MADRDKFYEDVEDSIIARLNSFLADYKVDVEKVPESARDFTKPFKQDKVTVAYAKSEFGTRSGSQSGDVRGPMSVSDAVQQEELVIEINLQSRSRRQQIGDGIGGLRLLRIVRSILLGWRPFACDKMFIKEQGFVDYDSKAWEYAMVFSCHSYAVPEPDDEVIKGILKTYEFEESVE